MNNVVASVVVPSYQGISRLPRLLNAFADQELDQDFEVIIVIDGIDDGSVDLIKSESRFDVSSILFPENRGRVAALNTGFESARGDVLIRCDDDLAPRPDYIRKHVEAHMADAAVGVVGLCLNEYESSRYKDVYGADADLDFHRHAYEATQNLTWRYWGGNCSITKETWETVGPYDPDYRLYGWEDVDYGYRLHKAGIPVVLNPALETPHHIAAVTTQLRAQRAFHSAAARKIFESKHGADHLPSAVPPMSAWNALVRGTSHVAGLNPKQFGKVVDGIIPHVPDSIARKMVALAVEASAVAGYRKPQSARDVF